MQATISKRFSRFSVVAVALVGILSAAALAAVLLSGAVNRPGTQPAVAPQVSASSAAPQITSDELYALEAGYDLARLHGRSAAVAMTPDMAYALEAEQVARQQAAQADRLFITSDELFAIEAPLAELNRR